MKQVPLLATTLVLSLLAACGGSGDDPDPTNFDSSFTISSASDPVLNGVYANANTPLSGVNKFERVGATDSCVFNYENIPRVGGGAVAEGTAEYLVDTQYVHRLSMKLAGITFSASPVANSSVSRDTHGLHFSGSMLTENGQAITVTGRLPMRTSRPAGC